MRSWIKAAGLLACLVVAGPTSARDQVSSHAQTGPGLAGPNFSLAEALRSLRTVYPAAEVTGRFSDWRTVSIYRGHAGLHNGYDIAMPTGARVPVPWAGVVTAVTPWGYGQFAVTVLSGGIETSYGHLTPKVQPGTYVMSGDVVGCVAIDHVDIKMRDLSGRFIDFGAGDGEPAEVDPAVMLERSYRTATTDLATLKARMQERKRKLADLGVEKTWLLKERSRLTRIVPQVGELVTAGAISHRDGQNIPAYTESVLERLDDVTWLQQELKDQQLQDEAEQITAQLELDRLRAQGVHPPKAAQSIRPEKPARQQPTDKVDPKLKHLVDDGALCRREVRAIIQRLELRQRAARLRPSARSSANPSPSL